MIANYFEMGCSEYITPLATRFSFIFIQERTQYIKWFDNFYYIDVLLDFSWFPLLW